MLQDLSAEKINIYLSDDTNSLSNEDEGELAKLLNSFIIEIRSFLFTSKYTSINKDNVELVEFSLNICGNDEIRELNNEYRGKDKITDVLSFQLHDGLRYEDEGEIESFINLGDIIICKDVASSQAAEFKISLAQEIVHLFVHGFLHLCGFDHEISEDEEKLMFELEEKLVGSIYKRAGVEK